MVKHLAFQAGTRSETGMPARLAIEHLGLHGVKMPWGVESDSVSRWVMLTDPAGNLIELEQFGG